MGLRARIVLAAAGGEENLRIAERLGVAPNTVVKWRKRFFEEGMDASPTESARADPGAFPPLAVAELKELACELPATTGVPLSRWSCSELARELVLRAVVATISAATVWRVLHDDAIRPWFHRSWIFPRDPDFAAKSAVALDPYARGSRARHWGQASSWSARTRRPASRPAASSTRSSGSVRARRSQASRRECSSSTRSSGSREAVNGGSASSVPGEGPAAGSGSPGRDPPPPAQRRGGPSARAPGAIGRRRAATTRPHASRGSWP